MICHWQESDDFDSCLKQLTAPCKGHRGPQNGRTSCKFPSPLLGLSIYKDSYSQQKWKFHYLSAQKLNFSKNKTLCFILYLLMPFLRLQGFVGKFLPKDTLAKSNTTCNGWGTTCPRKRSGPRIHPPCNFPSLSYFPSAPSPNSYNQEKSVYVPSQV